jgi:hypothetical protein
MAHLRLRRLRIVVEFLRLRQPFATNAICRRVPSPSRSVLVHLLADQGPIL